jgi:lipoprotein-releasing system permease protein
VTGFELFVALRYLRIRRKEAVISVVTLISVTGVAVGVAALIISLAINNGFRNTLQRDLLGATAHVNLLAKEPGQGISDWPKLVNTLRKLPHVIAAAPVLYSPVYLSSPLNGTGAVLKGIDVRSELSVSDALKKLKSGSLAGLTAEGRYPGIILGSKLAQEIGASTGSLVQVITAQGQLTPFGLRPGFKKFRVSGTFESGFYDLDDKWAYAALPAVQQILSLPDVVNSLELKLDNLYLAPEVSRKAEKLLGPQYSATNWEEQNRQLLNALKMERVVTSITIGMIEIVAAINILITLTMIVMEKYRDIAVLISLGARKAQVRRILLLQGLIIGATGTGVGLILGYGLSFLANRYHWIALDESVYALSWVPFEPRLLDGVWVAAAALLVSTLATLYPARNAVQVLPAEVLRYE